MRLAWGRPRCFLSAPESVWRTRDDSITGPVEQTNDGGVDMPHLVVEWFEAPSWVSRGEFGVGAVASRISVRGGRSRRQPDGAEPLGQDRERPGGHVTVL